MTPEALRTPYSPEAYCTEAEACAYAGITAKQLAERVRGAEVGQLYLSDNTAVYDRVDLEYLGEKLVDQVRWTGDTSLTTLTDYPRWQA